MPRNPSQPTATPTRPTNTTGAGFFDSPALSKDKRPAGIPFEELGQSTPTTGKSGSRRRGAGGRKTNVDSPAVEKNGTIREPNAQASPVRQPAVVQPARTAGTGKSVFDSPVSSRRTPQAAPPPTTAASLKPNGRSVFDMPVLSASPSTDAKVKAKPRKRTPGTGKKGKKDLAAVVDVGSGDDEPEAWYRRASLEDVLDELSSRFISNLSQEELASPERVCFQIEQAHWFYEDFIREAQPTLPTYRLKDFCKIFFAHSPLLSSQWGSDAESERAFERFLVYKKRVPVCGAIMLNTEWTKCVLVKGWKSGSSWGFPKGKMNNDEPKHLCAIREVEEETGYNCGSLLNEQDYIQCDMNDQVITLFIVTGVPEDTAFAPQTRKEISAIEWFDLQDLPTWYRRRSTQARPAKFFMITPFVAPLKEWMRHVMDVQGGSSSETDEAIDEVVHVDPAHKHEAEHVDINLSPGAPAPPSAPPQEAITANVNGGPSVLDDLFSKFTVASEKKEAKHGAETRQRAEESKADPAMQALLEKLMHGRNGSETPEARPVEAATPKPAETVDSKQGKQQALMEKLMSSLGATPVKSPLPTYAQHTQMHPAQHLQSNGQLPSTPSKEIALPFGPAEPHPHHPYSAINDGGFPMLTHNPALAALNGHVHPTMPHQSQGAYPPPPHFGTPNGQPSQAGMSHMTANLLNVLSTSRPGDAGPVTYSPRQAYASPSLVGQGQQYAPQMQNFLNSMTYGQSVPPPMQLSNQHQPPQPSLLGMLSSPQPSMAQSSTQSTMSSAHPFSGPLPGPIQLPLQPGIPELNRILPYQALPIRAMESDVGYLMHTQPPPQFQQMHPSHALSPPHHPASTAQAHQLLALLNPRDHVQAMTSPSTASAKTADGLLAMLVGNNRQGEGHG